MHLDGHTLLVLNLVICTVNAFGIATIWFQNRLRYKGISLWLFSIAMQVIGLVLILLHGIVPEFLSLVLSNIFMALGAIVLLVGLERFVNLEGPRAHHPFLLTACAGLLSYYTYFQPAMRVQPIVMSVIMTIIASQTTWLLLCKVDHEMRKVTHIVGIVMSVYVLLNLARITLFLFAPPVSHDVPRTGEVDAIATIMHIALNAFLTISLTLMVNKRLLHEVQAQEEKFSKAFHRSPHTLVLTRLSDGKIFEVNEEFVKTTGYSYQDVLGKTTSDIQLWQSREDRDAFIAKLSRHGSVQGVEQQFKTKAGGTRTGLISAETITINNEKSVLSNIVDLTERKQAEKERLLLEQRLQQVQKSESLARMAGAIAHNFNNMLCAAMGNLELALLVAPDRSGLHRYLSEAMNASQRAATMSRMLTYLGQTSGEAQPLDFAKAIKEACALLSASMPANVHLSVTLPPPGSAIKANGAHLTQILTNLITNGVEAIAEQEGEIALTIDVVRETKVREARLFPPGWEPKANEYACISIADTGHGIDQENLDKIFDPFFSTKFTGRGLGLAVVLGLLRSSEGAISVDSHRGGGATFKVFLPVSEQEPLTYPKDEAPAILLREKGARA
jgi:PAS domain S-box-containing protein